MRRRFPLLAAALVICGAVTLAAGYVDSLATQQLLERTCPSGVLFAVQTCLDLSARLRLDGLLIGTGFVVLALGFVVLGIRAFRRVGQGTPDIPVHFFGPRTK